MYITFCDTTLRDGEQTPGVHFGIAQKLDIAKQLREAGVDVIEAGFPASSPGDAEAVRRVAEEVGRDRSCTISALSRMMKSDIDVTARALAYRADSVVVHGTKTIRATDVSGRYNDSATIRVIK